MPNLAQEMFDFRKVLVEKGIIFCYSGYMTEEVLTSIGKAVRLKLELEAADKKTARNVFSVFVEQVQNVIRYSAEKEDVAKAETEQELRYGVLTVGKSSDSYFICCSNVIKGADVSRLQSSLSEIKSLDADGLKRLYKETLKGETPEGSKGAGVGFIDIARKASKGFEFDFVPMDEQRSYFSLKAFI